MHEERGTHGLPLEALLGRGEFRMRGDSTPLPGRDHSASLGADRAKRYGPRSAGAATSTGDPPHRARDPALGPALR
ncbi:hypothetical protein TVNIR_2452 [Thioalkalivibrio nitratireducens DSM 14787]|uniref:Uncharacterized protein n=2 Tax=Thioalkalivibrio nitratireducens TaxID=186931 RepID=L0DYQ7_THIND|nr:hypothetical protein TVNIR_2452 [Thioalkalivibrio nitratireducens DSM 14787]